MANTSNNLRMQQLILRVITIQTHWTKRTRAVVLQSPTLKSIRDWSISSLMGQTLGSLTIKTFLFMRRTKLSLTKQRNGLSHLRKITILLQILYLNCNTTKRRRKEAAAAITSLKSPLPNTTTTISRMIIMRKRPREGWTCLTKEALGSTKLVKGTHRELISTMSSQFPSSSLKKTSPPRSLLWLSQTPSSKSCMMTWSASLRCLYHPRHLRVSQPLKSNSISRECWWLGYHRCMEDTTISSERHSLIVEVAAVWGCRPAKTS